MAKKFVKPVAGSVVAFALCFSSTVASAATLPAPSAAFAPASINPFVALSAYGTIQSQSAVCAAAGTAAAAAAATAEGQPAAGCVLPVVDPVAAATPAPVAPVAYAPVPGGGLGLGVGAILAGLIAVAGLAAVLLSGKDHGRLPVTPD